MNQYSILVCDDDKAIVDAVQIYLELEGYKVIKAYDGKEALEALKKNEIHVIVMDIMMPNMDGLSATLKLRETKNIPVILLSAKSEDTDKIIGLNFGADDYMTKPFNSLELIARIKSQLRRYTALGGMEKKTGLLQTGGLALDKDAREVTVDGEMIKLTPTEYGILLYLMENMGRVLSINQIYENVWEEESYQAENTVSVHIRHIREKIEINPKEPKYLKVVWGSGYKMEKI